MFTGIVEHLGTVSSVNDAASGRTMVVDAGPLSSDLATGKSLAVNGTCLTVVEVDGPDVTFETVGETLDRTNLGDVTTGDSVNLERPLPAMGRFDGHLVQGHVDGVGTVRELSTHDLGATLTVEVPPSLMRYIAHKGSITVDGVSLTVASLEDNVVEVTLIPHTMDVTTLGARVVGDRVNLEVDVLAKYVERLLGTTL